MKNIEANYNRVLFILIFGILALSWVSVNASSFLKASVIYLILGGISYVYFTFNKKSLFGIDKNWVFDSFVGVAVFGVFFLLTKIAPGLAIGIPSLPQSVASDYGRFIIVVIGAGIFETTFFHGVMLDYFDNKVKDFGTDLPYWMASVITSIAFAFFHFVAYSGSLAAAGGSFLSAGVISFGWCYLRKYTKSLWPVMISHMLINAAILLALSVVLGV